jgi:hypothetical protein
MIVTKLQGGLANQIFQWAYAKSLEIQYNVPMMLDISYYYKDNGTDTKRIFCLDKFPNLKFNVFSGNEKFINVSDDSFFKEIKIDTNLNYYLNGFWQNENYFKINKNEIFKELAPTELIKKELLDLYPSLNSNTTSIHIRRTDYLKSNGYHPVQSIEYYRKAIESVGENDNLLIFSDDIRWCKDNLDFENMIFSENNDDIIDLWLMSLCENNIIANSSFSWWGAYLNSNIDKKVVAPSLWYGQFTGKYHTLPEDWIII